MLNKSVLTILSVVLLTITGVTTSFAGPGNGNSGGSGGDSSSSLTELEEHHLLFMREEEKLARDVYDQFFTDYGNLIFDNISDSEQNHMDAIKNLLDKYSLDDPILGVGEFDDKDLQDLYSLLMDFATDETQALIVGAMIEETDMADILHAIHETSHEDINDVYESLMCGSRNHLRAFIKQLEAISVIYEPIILLDGHEFFDIYDEYTDFDDLADSDMERDCGANEDDDDDDDGNKGKGKS